MSDNAVVHQLHLVLVNAGGLLVTNLVRGSSDFVKEGPIYLSDPSADVLSGHLLASKIQA
jgi:hypothetical protein